MPKKDLLLDFLWTWKATEDGRNLGQVHGQEILIVHVLIHGQLGNFKEGVIDVANATFEEAKTTLKRIARSHVFVENE
jgi:hypothetical protein